jgi:murein tripeptide amidase MpaA
MFTNVNKALFNFVNYMLTMEINNWYQKNFEETLTGRYITLQHLIPLLDNYKTKFEISVIGSSELGDEIAMLKIGSGSKTVLGWSQMHGNESTTTKALFDFLKFISQKNLFQNEIAQFLAEYTFCLIPILNPDGAKLYTRENANGIDLNRDAQNLSQK